MGAFFDARPNGRAIAGHAWKSLFAAIDAMPLLFLSAMALAVLFSAATFGVGFFGKALLAQHQVGLPLQIVVLNVGIQLVETLAWAALAAPVAVAMHRFVLMDEISRGMISLSPRHTRLFLCWLAAIRLTYVLISSLSFISSSHGMMLLLVAVIAITSAVVSVYLTMLFPAVATEVPSESISARIKTSMTQMKGNFWLFVRAAILAFLPVIFLLFLGQLIFVGHLVAAMTTGKAFFANPGLVLMAVLFGIYAIAGVALAAALASWLYAWVRQQPGH